ncbi:MAG: preprotein translocase subunit SecE [Lentisphaerae bacterium]|nr:preprotein translocase subunit SecE [Lentisphaerota bacterium]
MEKSKKGFSAGLDSITGRIRRFCADTMAELRRCSWPNRQQLIESTLLVVVAMVILACFVAGVDYVAQLLIRFMTVHS